MDKHTLDVVRKVAEVFKERLSARAVETCPRCGIRLDELNPLAPGCDYCGLCAWELTHPVRERVRALNDGNGPGFTMKLISAHKPRLHPNVRRGRKNSE